MGKIHIRDAGASDNVACHSIIARHDHAAVNVGSGSFCFITSFVGTFSERLFVGDFFGEVDLGARPLDCGCIEMVIFCNFVI